VQVAGLILRLSNPGILRQYNPISPFEGELNSCLFRYQEAIAQYQEALERDPKNSMVRLNLALAQYKQAEFEKASAELESLRKEHTGSRQSLYLLTDCYLRLGKDSDACHQDVRRKSQPGATNIRLECSGGAHPKQDRQM
jgi:tetratricopeptide (TPR) repeat protein